MGNVAFFTEFLATAKKASSETGVLTSVILAQWADETGYGESLSWHTASWNFAGISPGGVVASYQNRTFGLTAYIQNLSASTYKSVRQAKGWQTQAIALGESPWAGGHYDATGGGPGSDLIKIIEEFNLVQYDTGALAATASTSKTTVGSETVKFYRAYPKVTKPAVGFSSDASADYIAINGTSITDLVGDSLITVQLTLAITSSSTITVSLHDPTRVLVTNPVLKQASTLTFKTGTKETTWVLRGIEKAGNVLNVTFVPWVVQALTQATGAFVIAPGSMTRTQFAALLVSQITGAEFWSATESYLASLKEGYAHTNKEQLSRGTVANPLESSWTALQRLAAEIQWVCFESFGKVYFGPYSYLASLTPVLRPREFTEITGGPYGGITTIDWTYTSGQPLGELTIQAVASNWVPEPGQAVLIQHQGPANGTWIVKELTREDLEEPTITVTCMQPQPSLPEPSTGGTLPAAGSGTGSAQSVGGSKAAAAAVSFAMSKVGHPYSETMHLRLGPTYYDCSGLVYEAYLSVGIKIGTWTGAEWPNGSGAHVPAGVSNLKPGDLVFFGPVVGGTSTHVAMVVKVNTKTKTAHIVEAADPTQGVITDTFTPTVGTPYGSTLLYLGATRPAP